MSGPPHKDYAGAKLGMWIFLFTELLLFGGLFLLYAVYLARYPQEFTAAGREMHLVLGTLNTAILITGSYLAAMAVTAIQRDERRRAIGLLGGRSSPRPYSSSTNTWSGAPRSATASIRTPPGWSRARPESRSSSASTT